VLGAQPGGEHTGGDRDRADREVGHRRAQAQRERAAEQDAGGDQHQQVMQSVAGQRTGVLVPDGEDRGHHPACEQDLPDHVHPQPVPGYRFAMRGDLDTVGLHGRSPYR
jgi:hypothetical protein